MTVIGHPRFSATTHRRIASLLTAVVAAMALTIAPTNAGGQVASESSSGPPAVPTPEGSESASESLGAQAERLCSEATSGVEVLLDDGAVFADVSMYRGCSDGRSYVYGTVVDLACDKQGGKVDLWFYNRDAAANVLWNWVSYRHEQVNVSGCGEGEDFEYSSTNPDPVMYACARATSFWSQSAGHCEHF